MQSQPEKTQPTPSRVPYRTPKLVKYGKLASLVQSGTAPGIEDGQTFTSIPQ